MDKDALGDRMKELEGVEAHRLLDQTLPICIRLDGRGFSSFTKGMDRPFDVKMQNLMKETTLQLVKVSNAIIGYTQSDEISLILHCNPESQSYFGGRVQKICSSLAADASVYFNSRLPEFFPERINRFPTFDCRAWNVPSKMEACNTLIWRELDASKNSIQMAARSLFSHRSLQDLNGEQLKSKMLLEAGIDWNDYPVSFKRGSYFQRVKVSTLFSKEEIETLPLGHNARKNPELIVERSRISNIQVPQLSTIANIIDCLFDGAAPVLKDAI